MGKHQSQDMYIEDDYLIINYSYPYEIELDRIDTPEKVLGWVAHLCGKTWMDNDKIERFIDFCGSINGVNYRAFN